MRAKRYPRVAVRRMRRYGPARPWWVVSIESPTSGAELVAQQATHAGALAVAVAIAYPREAYPERWTP